MHFCKNWLENDVLVGYRDINSNQIDLNSWFEDREIQEFIEKIEKKSNKINIKSKFQSQQKNIQESSESSIEESYYGSDSADERRLPWPGV